MIKCNLIYLIKCRSIMCHISIRTFIYIFCFQLMLLQFSAVFFQFFSRLCVFQQPKNKLLHIFWSQWYIFTCALFDFLQIYTKIYIKVIVITWWALSLRATKFLAWWTRSIPWLLMTWLLTSPGHQQPWYWLCKIHKLLVFRRNNFNNLHHFTVEERYKIQKRVNIFFFK